MDYTSGPYSVTFPAGVMGAPFNISVNDDNIFEENENFTLTINSSLPTGVMVGNPGQATVTIVDNDRKPYDSYYLLTKLLRYIYVVASYRMYNEYVCLQKMNNGCSCLRTRAATSTTFWYPDIWMSYRINTKLIVNTKCILNFPI